MKMIVSIVVCVLYLTTISPTQAQGKIPLSDCLDLSASGAPLMFSWKVNPKSGLRNQDQVIKPLGYFDFPYEQLLEKFAPGKGYGLFSNEGVGGNVGLLLHSGYFDQKQLEAEWLRDHLEGGQLNADRTEMELYDSGTRLRKIRELVGATLIISQITCTVTLRLNAIAFIPHRYVGEFSNDLQNIMQAVLVSQTGETKKKFEDAVYDPQQHLEIVFCGWGSNVSYSNWGTWTRYVLDFVPISPDTN